MIDSTTRPFLKVVTVDDSPLIAERMDSILREIENLAFLGNAFSISSAQNLIKTVQPDVVILDIHLKQEEQNQAGIDLLVEIRRDYPQTKIIVFTNQNELHYRLVCFEKGANYFFDKSKDAHKISKVLKQWMIKK